MDKAPLPRVVFTILGPNLDQGRGFARWERWRPTVSLARHEDLLIHRMEILYQTSFLELAKQVLEDLRHIAPETEIRLHPIRLDDPWDFQEVYGALHDFTRAYSFSPEHEDYLVHITTGTHVAQICLFLLAESRHFPARLLQTSPPRREHPGGPGTYEIIDLDLSRYDRLASRFQAEQTENLAFLKSGIETKNKAFNRLIERIELVAGASRAPILLRGSTGVGKSQLARRIFELKKSRCQIQGDFIDINCATLRGDTAMAALFGHTKGAFTGAMGERQGLLRRADGGVLFLDEIGELGLDEQAMLLRAIEEKVFYPVGSDKEVRSDFLLLAGTNRDLGACVAQGKFREDLLARICIWTFHLPGLRERPEDIEPNLRYEMERVGQGLHRHVTMSREAIDKYLDFAMAPGSIWRSNFRDLNASVLRMATLAKGGRISIHEVEEERERLLADWQIAVEQEQKNTSVFSTITTVDAPQQDRVTALLGQEQAGELDRFDRVQLEDVLRVCQASQNLSAAGRVLFASSRTKKSSPNDADRLRKYLARFDLSWQQIETIKFRFREELGGEGRLR